jgi:hypothetical protein
MHTASPSRKANRASASNRHDPGSSGQRRRPAIVASRWLALGVALVGLPSCFESAKPEASCEIGALGCGCGIDGDCDRGLSCIKDACVLSVTSSGGKADGAASGGKHTGGDSATGNAQGGASASGGTAEGGAISNAGAGAATPDPGEGGSPAGGAGSESAGSAGAENESSGGAGGTITTATGGRAAGGSLSTGGSSNGGRTGTGGSATGGSTSGGSAGWGPDGPPSGEHGGSPSTAGAASGGSAGTAGSASALPSSCLSCTIESCTSERIACRADATCLSCVNTDYRSDPCAENAAYQAMKSCFCGNFCGSVCESACK